MKHEFYGADKLIYKLAAQYKRSGSPAELEDLIQEGFLAYMVAMEKFDPERGVKPTTWVYKRVKGAIHRASKKRFNIRAHEGVRIDTLEEPDYIMGTEELVPKVIKLIQIEDAQAKIEKLTDQQICVLHGRVHGKTLVEIGEELGVKQTRVHNIESKTIEIMKAR